VPCKISAFLMLMFEREKKRAVNKENIKPFIGLDDEDF
jgi:hypothetical protein